MNNDSPKPMAEFLRRSRALRRALRPQPETAALFRRTIEEWRERRRPVAR